MILKFSRLYLNTPWWISKLYQTQKALKQHLTWRSPTLTATKWSLDPSLPTRRQSWCLLVCIVSITFSLNDVDISWIGHFFCGVRYELFFLSFWRDAHVRHRKILGLSGRCQCSHLKLELECSYKNNVQLVYQAYVECLATVREEALKAAGTKIVVIGCGEWNLIKTYAGMPPESFIFPFNWLCTTNLPRNCQIQWSTLRWSNS